MRIAFHQLLAARVVSICGNCNLRLAIPILVYELTGSPLMMSAAVACWLVPYVLMLPIGGAIADRVPRQILLCWGDFVAGLCCAAICCYLLLGGQSAYFILSALFGLGLITAMYDPAFQGFVPRVVDQTELARANSLFVACEQALNLAMPIISGGLLVVLSANQVIWLNVTSYLISGAIIAAIKLPAALPIRLPRLSAHQLCEDLRVGFRIAWSHPIVKWGTVLLTIENFGTNLVVGNMIFVLVDHLALSASAAGDVIGLSAVGAVAGSLLAPHLMRRFYPGLLVLVCVFAVMAGTLIMLLATTAGVTVIVIGRGVIMAAEGVIIVTMFTLRQSLIEGPYLSRTIAITRTISAAPVPIATMAGGYILAHMSGDVSALILTSALVLLLCCVVGLFTPMARMPLKYADAIERAGRPTSHPSRSSELK